MFAYVQPSLMKNDSIHRLVLRKRYVRFCKVVQEAMALCDFLPDQLPWFSFLSDEDFWEKAKHPLLGYWSERKMVPLLQEKNWRAVQRELQSIGRFFVIPILKQTGVLPPMTLYLDDRGDLRFPGHPLYVSLGPDWKEREIKVRVWEGRFWVTSDLGSFAIDTEELLSHTQTKYKWLARQVRIGDTPIEWQPSDEIVRSHLAHELLPILRGQDFAEEVMIPPREMMTMADIWYYEKVLAVIQDHWPQMYSEIAGHIQMVNLLDTDKVGGYTVNFFPGAVFLSHRPGDLHWTIENLIHECSHARMYQLFELDPIFCEEDERRFTSPWRNDPRPLSGLFHAVFVFTRIAIWYDRLLEKNRSQEIKERLSTILSQLEQALQTLREEARFTAIGQAVFSEMEQYHKSLQQSEPLPALSFSELSGETI